MKELSVLRGVLAMVAGAGLLTLNDAVSKHLTQHFPIGRVMCLRQLAAFMVARGVYMIRLVAPRG